MDPCAVGQVMPVRLDELGDHFRRYRLRVPQAVQAMAVSLRRWGSARPSWRRCERNAPRCSTASPAGRLRGRCGA